jgi:DnaK suppressor protein
MPKAKQPGAVETQENDAAAEVQVNGAKPGRTLHSAEGKSEAAKRANVKASRGAREASKEDVDTKTQHTKQHAKAEPVSRAHETGGHADPAPKSHETAARPKKPGTAVDETRDLFLEHQRELLTAERNNYTRQAEELKAQADALALEHEPGDVQFDEEGGEGGTANVDRELDLHLSAQAQAAIEEIDAALIKIAEGTYGFCESCGNPVPKARLEALPHARLCVSCKSGGLTARRQ